MKYKSGCAKAIKISLALGLTLKSNLNFPTKHKILRKIKANVKRTLKIISGCETASAVFEKIKYFPNLI